MKNQDYVNDLLTHSPSFKITMFASPEAKVDKENIYSYSVKTNKQRGLSYRIEPTPAKRRSEEPHANQRKNFTSNLSPSDEMFLKFNKLNLNAELDILAKLPR
jgi:hypothetical protein